MVSESGTDLSTLNNNTLIELAKKIPIIPLYKSKVVENELTNEKGRLYYHPDYEFTCNNHLETLAKMLPNDLLKQIWSIYKKQYMHEVSAVKSSRRLRWINSKSNKTLGSIYSIDRHSPSTDLYIDRINAQCDELCDYIRVTHNCMYYINDNDNIITTYIAQWDVLFLMSIGAPLVARQYIIDAHNNGDCKLDILSGLKRIMTETEFTEYRRQIPPHFVC